MRRKYLPDNSRQANSWSQLPALTDSSKSHFKNCYSFWYILSLSLLVQIKNLIPTRGGNWSSNTTCSLRSDTAWNLVKKPNRFHLSTTMALTIKGASVLLVRMTNWASNTNKRKKKEQENTWIVPFHAIFYAHIYLNLISKTDHIKTLGIVKKWNKLLHDQFFTTDTVYTCFDNQSFNSFRSIAQNI